MKNIKLIETFLKCEFFRYSLAETRTINTAISQKFNILPKDDSVISLLNIYLDSKFDVLDAASNNRYTDGNVRKLDNLNPIGLCLYLYVI